MGVIKKKEDIVGAMDLTQNEELRLDQSTIKALAEDEKDNSSIDSSDTEQNDEGEESDDGRGARRRLLFGGCA